MPKFTLETTYHMPIYRHRTIEAESLAQACRLAVEDDDWSAEKRDYESAGETFVSGAWEGEDAAYRGTPCAIPSHYGETEQGKATHFDALLAVLKEPARPMGLSAVEFERWLPRGGCHLQGRGDPGGPPRSGGVGHGRRPEGGDKMMARLSTYTVALVSTAHLRSETLQTLESWAGPVPLPGQPMTCAQDTYGFWIWTGYHEHDEVPAELRDILRLAQSKGCEYARFDRDEEPDGTLPVFEEAPENPSAAIRNEIGAAGVPTPEEG